MSHSHTSIHSRGEFIIISAAITSEMAFVPNIFYSGNTVLKVLTRLFRNLVFGETSIIGLIGRVSIQWTPADIDPVKIILKAFRQLSLVQGISGYNEKLRRSIFLTSKANLRKANNGFLTCDGFIHF